MAAPSCSTTSPAQSPDSGSGTLTISPAYSLADTQAVAKAFTKVPLIVSLSSYMDETAAMAHYILPSHVHLERYEDAPAAAGFPKPILGLSKPACKPVYNTKYVGDVVMALAKAVGGPVARMVCDVHSTS